MEINIFVLVFILIASIFGVFIIFYFIPIGTWFQAIVSGIRITLIELIFMRFRKVPPALIVKSMIALAKGGLLINKDDLEAHFLAGGNVENVTDGLIYAKAAGIQLSFKEASRLDLAKKNIISEISPKE